MKVFQICFHKWLFNDFQYISEQLKIDSEYIKFTDGETKDSSIYNIDHHLAKKVWD